MMPSENGELYLDRPIELDVLSEAFSRTDVGHILKGDMPAEVIAGEFSESNQDKKVLLTNEQIRLARVTLNTFMKRYSYETTICAFARNLRNQIEQHLSTLDS